MATKVAEARIVLSGDGGGATKAAAEVEAAFRQLGVKSSEAMNKQMADASAAFEKIKNSGTASTADILRAQQAFQDKVAQVTSVTIPAQASAMGVLHAATQPATQAMEMLGVNTGLLGQAFTAMTSPTALVAEGFAVIAAAVTLGINAMMAFGAEAKRVHIVSDLSVEKSGQLVAAFRLMGKDTEAVTNAMFKMAQEVDTGGVNLRALGVSIRDSSGSLKGAGDIFLEVRDKVSALSSSQERNIALREIFGRQGRELAGVFALEKDKFDALMVKAGAILPWSEEQQAQVKKYNLALHELDAAWEGLKIKLGSAVIGKVTVVIQLGASAVENAGSLYNTIGNAINAAATKIGSALDPAGLQDFMKQTVVASQARIAAQAQLSRDAVQAELDAIGEGVAKKKTLSEDERKAFLANIEAVKTGRLDALALEDARLKESVTFGVTSAVEAAARAIDLAGLKKNAEIASIDAQLAGLKELKLKDDDLNNARTDLLTKRQHIEAAAQAQQIQAIAQLAELSRTTWLANTQVVRDASLVQTEAWLQSTDARTAMEQNFASALIQITGTDEQKFLDAEQRRVMAAAAAAEKILGERTAATFGAEMIQKESEERIAAFRQQQTQRALDVLGTWAHSVDALMSGQTGAVQREFDKQRGIIESHYAVLLSDASLSTEQRETLEGQYLATVTRLNDTFRGQRRQADLADRIAEKQRLADRQEDQGDYFGFLTTQLKLAAAQSATVYQGMTTGVQTFATGATNSFSDFFNFTSKNFGDLKTLEAGVLQSMAKAISDFLAQQTVKKFMEFGADVASNWTTSLSGIGGTIVSAASKALGAVGDVIGSAVSAISDFLPFAVGGFVPERMGTDTVPAMLTPGEFVVPADIATTPAFQSLMNLFGGFRVGARGLTSIGGGSEGGIGSTPGLAVSPTHGSAAASPTTLAGMLADALGVPSFNVSSVFGLGPSPAQQAANLNLTGIEAINSPNVASGKGTISGSQIVGGILGLASHLAGIPTLATLAMNVMTFGLVHLGRIAERAGLIGSPHAGLAASLSQAQLAMMGFNTLSALHMSASTLGIDPDTFSSMNLNAGKNPFTDFNPFTGMPNTPNQNNTNFGLRGGIDTDPDGNAPGPTGDAPSDAGGGVSGVFERGGSFFVPGSGGTDSQRINIRATPGERIDVTAPASRGRRLLGSGGGTPVVINYPPSARGGTITIKDIQKVARSAAKSGTKLFSSDVVWQVNRG